MTPIGIEHNLRRLTFFLHSEDMIPSHAEDIDQFLHVFGRYMDYYGCGREQLSRIILTQPDFDEMAEFVRKLPPADIYSFNPKGSVIQEGDQGYLRPPYLSFQYVTFTWSVFLVGDYFERSKKS